MLFTSCLLYPLTFVASILAIMGTVFVISEIRYFLAKFKRFDFSGFEILVPLSPAFALALMIFLMANGEIKVGDTKVAEFKKCDDVVACQVCSIEKYVLN